MKRNLLFSLFTIFYCSTLYAQVVSVRPAFGLRGIQLNTTITLASGVLTMASPPLQNSDIYIQQGANTVFCSNFSVYESSPSVYTDSISADFDLNAPILLGPYDVHVITWTYDWWTGTYSPIDNLLSGGFFVGGQAGTIEGDVYFDANQNGINDAGDWGLWGKTVSIQPQNYNVITNLQGHYKAYLDTGAYTVTVQPAANFTLTSTPSSYAANVPPSSTGNDFGLYAPPPAGNQTQAFSVWTHAMRCSYLGFSRFTAINNSLDPAGQIGSISILHSSNLSYHSSMIPPGLITPTFLYWNYSTLLPGHTFTSDVIYNNPPAGDTVWYVVIDSVYDAAFTTLQQVYVDSFGTVTSCSVDPNDKHVSPSGEQADHYTLMNSELTYTINFQNTGNDTAFIVIIYDTLDANLDPATLEIMSSSDPVDFQIDGNGAMQFTFYNILLPDSNVDEPGSNGFVMYRVRPRPGLTDPTVITNTAHIVFDMNAAVVTNTTMNTMVNQIPVGIASLPDHQKAIVVPNPVTNRSELRFDNNGTSVMYEIFDVTGRILQSGLIRENPVYINRNFFSTGLYFYRITHAGGEPVTTGKFIVR
ncbi:MAG TPA: T9SS type A sorting domain-containing protein [Bacteroidia bacterium]|nr:T9SS type A sorting domain-containing protein [Bacteroidia bacterium]